MSDPAEQPVLAQKLTRLFDTLRDAQGRTYSDEHVSAEVARSGGPTISANYIYLLRTGRRDNPTKRHLEALAGFFGISPAYFFDDDLSAQITTELDMLAAMRDSSVRAVALRAAGLSPRARNSMLAMLTQLDSFEQEASDRSSPSGETSPPDASASDGSSAAVADSPPGPEENDGGHRS